MSTSEFPVPVVERRRRPTPAVSRYLFRGRRRRPEGESRYVDRPSSEAWKSALLLVCLSALDALLSLRLFEDPRFGEMNPILLAGLHFGDWAFLAIKLALTLFSVFILLIHWNFVIAKRRLRVVWLIRSMILAYLLIVVYEILLLTT